MTNLYSLYKPLRNLAKQFPIVKSYEYIWHFVLFIQNGKSLPKELGLGMGFDFKALKASLQIWEVLIALREITLNSDSEIGSRSLAHYSDVMKLINGIKKFDEDISIHSKDSKEIEGILHRIPYLQFPWQRKVNTNLIMRYYKILGDELVSKHVVESTGLDVRGLNILGLAITQHFYGNFYYNITQDYEFFGVNNQASYKFLNRLVISIADLKKYYKDHQNYDEKWMYTFNPLFLYPLISIDANNPNLVCCPFPSLFHKRITEGIYFDIVKSPRVGDGFGPAFQDYVGEVLKAVFHTSSFSVIPESTFMDGKKIKHGIDWIVSDPTANLFIECKTKRLRLEAKIDIDGETLKQELNTLAEAIVQTYKNIDDAVKGKSNWKPNGLQIYPFIITLEDWFLFSPTVLDSLKTTIETKLVQANLNVNVLEKTPYTIASIDHFETTCLILAKVGINPYMEEKTKIPYRFWDIQAFSNNNYPNAIPKEFKSIFAEEWHELCRDIIPRNKELIKHESF